MLYAMLYAMLFGGLLLLSKQGVAQGLGGKRWSLSYDAKMFNTLAEPMYRDQLKEWHDLLRFNYTHQLRLEVALGWHYSLGVTYQDFRTNSSDSEFYIFGHGLGTYVKGYLAQTGSLAPLGNWWKVGLSRQWHEVNRIVDFQEDGAYEHWVLQVGVGKQTVLYRHLLLNVGVEIGGGLGHGRKTMHANIDPEQFEKQVIGRINTHNTIFLHIGLCYVLF